MQCLKSPSKMFLCIMHFSSHTSSAWKVPGVLSCIQFAWSLTLAQIPSNASLMESSMGSILEQDEATLDMALAGQVFVFMKVTCVKIPI